jgi:phenylpropionate dioxygenase-like ring-hydroxylating dioxygenase large terminal subunit
MREENFLGTSPIQSWYLIASSRELRKNQILGAQLGRHKVVLFRNEHGIANRSETLDFRGKSRG